jgi:hypothetical protein
MGCGLGTSCRLGLAGVLLLGAAGCGPSLGAWIYTLGLVPDQKVAAEFTIPDGPVLALVDDDLGLVRPPLACEALVDAVGEQFKEHGVADRVTTGEELARLRQQSPDFDKLSIREVGRLAKADTVVWMRVEAFSVEDDLEMAVTPARFVVRVKVFNTRAEHKKDVRLWPGDPEGRTLSVTVNPHDLRACQNRAGVHQKLADEMADKVAKLFYNYRIKR